MSVKSLALLLLLMFTLGTAQAYDQERWILVGDSIQSRVPGGTASQLTANLVQQNNSVIIHNISSPGAGMSGVFGFINTKAILGQISGYYKAKGVILTVATNDWGRTPTSQLFTDYKAYVVYAKSLGLEVVCVSPIWRSDMYDWKTAPGDTQARQLDAYTWTVMQACTQGGGQYISGMDAPLANLTMYYDDTPAVHLNGAGHGVFYSWLLSRMNGLGYWL